jgi:UrcA family protein
MLPLHRIHLSVIALLAMPMLLGAESAIAVPGSDAAPSEVVRYHDLDLNSPEGIASLYDRIHAAAIDVCKSAAGPGHQDLESWMEWDWCVNHAVAMAVKAVHNRKLSAYQWERIRSSAPIGGTPFQRS